MKTKILWSWTTIHQFYYTTCSWYYRQNTQITEKVWDMSSFRNTNKPATCYGGETLIRDIKTIWNTMWNSISSPATRDRIHPEMSEALHSHCKMQSFLKTHMSAAQTLVTAASRLTNTVFSELYKYCINFISLVHNVFLHNFTLMWPTHIHFSNKKCLIISLSKLHEGPICTVIQHVPMTVRCLAPKLKYSVQEMPDDCQYVYNLNLYFPLQERISARTFMEFVGFMNSLYSESREDMM